MCRPENSTIAQKLSYVIGNYVMLGGNAQHIKNKVQNTKSREKKNMTEHEVEWLVLILMMITGSIVMW
jgi:hypothetical protein